MAEHRPPLHAHASAAARRTSKSCLSLERHLAGKPPFPRSVEFRFVKADTIVAVAADDVAPVGSVMDEHSNRPLRLSRFPCDRWIADVVCRLIQKYRVLRVVIRIGGEAPVRMQRHCTARQNMRCRTVQALQAEPPPVPVPRP